MTLASGTRRGSALSTPSTSVQMWISSASSSAPKIEPEKSLPLRPSVVCRPFASRAMKPVMINVAGSRGVMRVGVRLRHVPAHGRAERSPFHRHDVARIDPLDVAGPAAAMTQIGAEQARRPDLAVAGDQIAHGLRGGADQLRRCAGCRRCRGSPARASSRNSLRGVAGRAACRRSPRGAGAAPRCGPSSGAFLALGGGDQIQQCIGDAAAGGQHDAEPRMRILLEDPSDALHAYRIGDAGAAELMYAPPFHLPGSLVALSRPHRAAAAVRRMTTGTGWVQTLGRRAARGRATLY